nr:unnamed protein product [Digitaria exilis]
MASTRRPATVKASKSLTETSRSSCCHSIIASARTSPSLLGFGWSSACSAMLLLLRGIVLLWGWGDRAAQASTASACAYPQVKNGEALELNAAVEDEETYNILVFEYICNRSLEWHLFDQSASVLEWHKRHAIAMGIAKGLRFLHEECRAGPIIHLDLHPSNVLLTHDFVPMLGDFGLAKWNVGNSLIRTSILGQSGYFAPEYAEYGIASVKTDVFRFGVLLFQLISGRKAEPLVETLAFHELIDHRIQDTYDTYGLYHLAKTAYLCVRTNPEQRPSMGEVVRLIDSKNEHIRDLSQQLVPHFTK